MKNQYVGDYGKHSLLGFLSQNDIAVGVNWYLTKKTVQMMAGIYPILASLSVGNAVLNCREYGSRL